MITRAKSILKKTKQNKLNRQDPRTSGKSEAMQTKITKKSIHIHTHTKEKKEKKIHISLLPKSTASILG